MAKSGKDTEQVAPLRAQTSLAVDHFVACHHGKLTSQPVRRKSSVRGCSRDSVSLGSAIGPGVWPNGKKRARRRASASFALTGKSLVVPAAGMRYVVRQATKTAAGPAVVDVEHQRRLRRDRRVQRTHGGCHALKRTPPTYSPARSVGVSGTALPLHAST